MEVIFMIDGGETELFTAWVPEDPGDPLQIQYPDGKRVTVPVAHLVPLLHEARRRLHPPDPSTLVI